MLLLDNSGKGFAFRVESERLFAFTEYLLHLLGAISPLHNTQVPVSTQQHSLGCFQFDSSVLVHDTLPIPTGGPAAETE
jgi:hypothetical protein